MERFTFNDEYLARLRRRDPAAWQHFDDFFRPRVRAKFRAKFPWDMVEDLTGATMLAAIESISRGEPRDAARLAGYVFSICHNKTLEAWRLLNKENLIDFDFDRLTGKGRTPLQEWINNEEVKKIRRVLTRLSSRDHDILICVLYDGQNRDDVCKKYGVERDHLKMILFHARQRFQREWGRD